MEWLQRHDHDGETSKPILGEWDLTVFAHYPLISQENYLLSFSYFGVLMTSICFYLFFCGFGVDGIVRRANLFIYFTVKVLS